MGDCLVSLPAMQHLRAPYTEVWVPSALVPLIRFADRVRALPSTGIDLVGITEPALPEWSRFDDIVSWYGTNRPEFRSAVAQLPFRFLPPLPDGSCHAVDFFMRHAGGPEGAIPIIECPGAADPFIAVHPFSGSPRKNWPLDKFQALAAELPLPVRFFTGPEQRMAGAIHIPDLYQLACWLASARLYIGNDSGPSHLAAAAGTPVVALFGPMDPAVWAPRGRAPVATVRREPVEQISVEEVLDAARRLLA